MEAVRGFVLTPTYRVVGGRPEVHLHAVLETGEPALLVDDRFRPYFFLRAVDGDRAATLAPSVRLTATDLRTFGGEPVVRVEVGVPGDVPPIRERLAAAGLEAFEADVRFASRYLIDHGIRGAFRVAGPFERRPGGGRAYRNADLRPDDWVPRLRVLAFDIETSPDARRLYALAAAGWGGDRVWLVRPRPGGATPADATPWPETIPGAEVVPDERAALAGFLAHLRAADPDVLTGWNVGDFDVPVLLRVAQRTGVTLTLGRTGEPAEVWRDPGFARDPRVVLAGRQVLDGLALVRGAVARLDDYRLDTAARAILGRGKLFAAERRGAEIEAAYRDDPAALAAYNLHDARLVVEILERTGLVELTVRRSLLTGLPLDRVGAQIAAVDSLYLAELRPRGRVAPSVRGSNTAVGAAISGGLVLESAPGLYRHILVFDFQSLYPSLIRTFNIDPLTHAMPGLPGDATGADPVVRTPGGAAFRADETGILPELVGRLLAERARARQAGDATLAQATKILMNSLFGVLGASASRLFSPAVANAITEAGQHVIRLAAAVAGSEGGRVIYGDTDSLFVDVGARDPTEAAARGAALREAIGREVDRALRAEFGCRSFLALRFEKVYARFLMPEVRGGAAGSKKRYAGLVVAPDGMESLELVGLEAVRRDWSDVARRFQRELLDHVLHDRPVEAFIRDFVAAVETGRHDGELVYRKALRKPLAAYTRTTPPHVRAARLQGEGAGRIVAYVMTRAGPEPAGGMTAPPDRAHYVVHQLRPLADSVLRLLGDRDFDAILGRGGPGRQLDLFEADATAC